MFNGVAERLSGKIERCDYGAHVISELVIVLARPLVQANRSAAHYRFYGRTLQSSWPYCTMIHFSTVTRRIQSIPFLAVAIRMRSSVVRGPTPVKVTRHAFELAAVAIRIKSLVRGPPLIVKPPPAVAIRIRSSVVRCQATLIVLPARAAGFRNRRASARPSVVRPRPPAVFRMRNRGGDVDVIAGRQAPGCQPEAQSQGEGDGKQEH